MRCEQVITGAVNNGSCVVATGQIGEQGFIVYASGSAVVILTPELGFVQKIEGKALGYGVTPALCVTSSEDCGRIAAAWGNELCIFEPECLSSEERLQFPKAFLYKWRKITSLQATCSVNSVSFDKPGDRLLTGGQSLQLWMATTPGASVNGGVMDVQQQSPSPQPNVEEDFDLPEWACTWKKELATATEFVQFSPDGQLFATAGKCDRAVKIWYEVKNSLYGVVAAPLDFTFTYVTHPRQVSSFSWRQSSPILPCGVVANVLLTRCHDNVCRVWAQTPCHQDHYDQSQPPHHAPTNSNSPDGGNMFSASSSGGISQPSACYKVGASLHFHLAGSIDPGSNIPHSFGEAAAGNQRTSLFTVHWMNNKNLCLQFAAKALKASEIEAGKNGASGRGSPLSVVSEDSLVIVNSDSHGTIESPDPQRLAARKGQHGSPARSPASPQCGDHLDAQQMLRRSPLAGRSAKIDGPANTERHRTETFMASSNWVVVPAESSPGRWVVVPSPSLGDDLDTLSTHGLSPKAVRALLHEWRSSPDMLFAIHPYDGSLLVWMMDGLDTVSPSFRLARLSFASRIPHAMPTADIWTLEGSIFTIAGPGPDDVEDIGKLLATPAKKHSVMSSSISGRSTPSAWMKRRRSDGVHNSSLMSRVMAGGGHMARLPSVVSSPDLAHPSLVLVSHHIGGAMHVWSVEFGRGSAYLTPFAMRRVGSAVGHRLPCHSSLVHPSSSLLMTAAHLQETVPDEDSESAIVLPSRASELILWQMHAPGRYESDGEALQLVSVLHSNGHAAFRQQCWIDSRLALTTLELSKPVATGGQSVVSAVGPSALFVSQNGDGALALFQVITDAVKWLALHGGAANSVAVEETTQCPKPRQRDLSSSLDDGTSLSSSTKVNGADSAGGAELPSVLRLGSGEIISRQCGDRPGCVLHLGELCSLDMLPGKLLLLHAFRLTDAWVSVIQSSTKVPPTHEEAQEEDDQFYGNADKPLVPEEIENFLVVAVETRSSHVSPVSRGAASGSSSPSSFIHSFLVSVHRRALVLPVDTKLEASVSPPVVEVSCRSLSAQQLHLQGAGHVTSASVSSDQTCAMSLEGMRMPAPWQIVTTCSDGSVQCWRCIGQSADLLGGSEVNDEHLDGHALGDGGSDGSILLPSLCLKWEQTSQPAMPTSAGSRVVAVSASSPSQLVALCCQDEDEDDDDDDDECNVQVWDSSSSGGHAWEKESLDISIPCRDGASSAGRVLPLWMPQHDGSNLLAVADGNRMSVMQCHRPVPGQARASWRSVSVTEVSNLQDVAAASCGESPTASSTEVPRITNDCCRHSPTARSMLPLAWCRGNLVVGYDNGSVILVLSHWLSAESSYKSSQTTCMSVQTVSGECCQLPSSLAAAPTCSAASSRAAGQAKEDSDRESVLHRGGSSGSSSSQLPQYHPGQLSQLLHAGRLYRVRSILAHLVRCLAQRALAERYLRSKEQPGQEQWLTSWWRPSASCGEKLVIRDLLPLSLSKLLSMDIQSLDTAAMAATSQGTNHDAVVEEKDEVQRGTNYDELFGSNLAELDQKLELKLDVAEEEETDASAEEIRMEQENLNAKTFGATQFDFLTSYLSKVRLAGLSSLDQMRLLALAQTVATTHHISTESAEDSQGADGAAGSQRLVGTGGAGGAGYASRAEGGEEGIDDCGVRFLLSMRQYTCLLHSVPRTQRVVLMEQGLSTAAFAWAFHSHAEEELLSLVPCVQSGRITWPQLRAVGVGWWLRSQESLRRLAEKIAKAKFSEKQDPMDGALFYLAMKKQSLMRAMFRNSRDDRLAAFFANNFTEERWRKAALNNAFKLLSKQRLEQAAAFFLLANSLHDCLEVILHKLHDVQLALVVCRLFEGLGEAGPKYQALLRKTVLDTSATDIKTAPAVSSAASTPRHSVPAASTSFVSSSSFGLLAGLPNDLPSNDQPHAAPCQDPFLRSLVYWILQDYGMAMDTVLENASSDMVSKLSPDADVSLFNFFFFLREHPLLLRRQFQSTQPSGFGFSTGGGFNLMGGNKLASTTGAQSDPSKPRISGVGSEPLTRYERKLLFQTAQAHMQQGRLLLVLDVLSHLPAAEADSAPPSPPNEEVASPSADTASSFDWSQPVADTASSCDWSAPVSVAADTSDSFDWGAPVALQSSLLEEDDGGTDWSKPVCTTMPLSDAEDSTEPAAAASRSPTPPAEEAKKPAAAHAAFSVTQWSALSLRWRAVLNLLLEELQTAGTHVMESELANEFVYQNEEKLRQAARSTDELATPTASLNPGLASRASAAASQASSQFKPIHCLQAMELRRFVWSLLVMELSVWDDMCGVESSQSPVQRERLLQALHGMAARHSGDQLADAGLKWISEHAHILACIWRYFDLHSAACPPLQSISLEIGALLQRPQLPALSVVHDVSVAMFTTELAVSDHSRAPKEILSEMAELLPQCMPPFLLSASPLPCHTLWSPLSEMRNIGQQIFSMLLNSPDLPSSSSYFDDRRVEHLTQLCGVLSTNVVQSLVTVDHTLSPRSLLASLSGRCSPFAFSLVHHTLLGGANGSSSARSSPPDFVITHDTPPVVGRSTPSSAGSNSIGSRQAIAAPSQWPGLRGWPRSMAGTDWCIKRCPDMVALSLLLGEACVAVYAGMIAVSLAKLSARQLLRLLKNMPDSRLWHAAFGGGYRVSTQHGDQAAPPATASLHDHRHSRPGGLAGHSSRRPATGGRDSTSSTRSDAASRRPKVVDVFMFPAVALDEFFRHGEEDDELPNRPEVITTEATDGSGKEKKKKWNYSLDDLSDSDDDDDEAAIPAWSNPRSAGWSLLQMATLHLLADGLKSFLPLVGVELAELPLWSPNVYNFFCQLDAWQGQAFDVFDQSSEDFRKSVFSNSQPLSGDSLDVGMGPPGPALLQHKALLDKNCTPFSGSSEVGAVACEQLWHYLVKQEKIRDTFIDAIFSEEAPPSEPAKKREGACLVFKEPDIITTIGINQTNHTQMVVGTSQELVEIDTSFLFDSSRLLWTDDEDDHHRSSKRHSTDHNSDGFLMVHSAADWPSRNSSPDVGQSQSGSGAVVMSRRNISGVRHVQCHPVMPYYLCGSDDGSVRLWEFGRTGVISSHRGVHPGRGVTRIQFTSQGNKFAAADVSGSVALWQFGSTAASSDPYVEIRCHNKTTNDFVFMKSSSFLATAGHSSDGKNVALYDFLVPPHKALIKGFPCHEGGATNIVYAPSHHLLISSGKKGDICMFDVRQRALLQSLPAHSDAIKSLAMADSEDFFVSGGADGAVKLWDVSVPRQRATFMDHVRTSFFRTASLGVEQVLLTNHSTQLFSCGADGLVKWRVLSTLQCG